MEENQFILCFLALLACCNADLPVQQPKTNVWVTLAKAAGSDTICMHHSNPEKPSSTCVVGVPVENWPIPIYYDPLTKKKLNSRPGEIANGRDPVRDWSLWTKQLLKAHSEPQELEILGSMPMDFSVTFPRDNWRKNNSPKHYVTPINYAYRNLSFWCNYSYNVNEKSGDDQYPRQLSKGYWFICGDRAWQGIPSYLEGGPYSIGALTVTAPSAKEVSERTKRDKRSIHIYPENCNSNFSPWKKAQRISASFFLPGIASEAALRQIDRIGCWLSKQTNATSSALSDMLTDVSSARQAVIQNRAAIDFLLLTNGHGCEEFAGMCCVNLSDHSESIHKSIQKLKDLTSEIKNKETWLDDLFDGWSLAPWQRQLPTLGGILLIVIVLILMIIPCACYCVRKMFDKLTKNVSLAQEKNVDMGITESSKNLTKAIELESLTNLAFELRPWKGRDLSKI